MPFPTVKPTMTDAELSAFYELELAANSGMFVADLVLPVTNVGLQAGQFARWPIEELLKADGDIERAPGSSYKEDESKFEVETYATRDYGVVEKVDEREAEMYSRMVDPFTFAATRAAHRVLLAKEKRVAAKVMDHATYSANVAIHSDPGNGKWDTANSTPIADVEAAGQKMYALTGYYPDTLIINRKVFRKLRLNPQVLSAIKSDGAGDQARQRDVTAAQLAAVFDVDRVVVAGGTQNTSPSGAATISQIWGDHAMLCVTTTSQDMRVACIGRQFHWGADGSMPSGIIEQKYDWDHRCWKVRARHEGDEKRIYTELGHMIDSVLT